MLLLCVFIVLSFLFYCFYVVEDDADEGIAS